MTALTSGAVLLTRKSARGRPELYSESLRRPSTSLSSRAASGKSNGSKGYVTRSWVKAPAVGSAKSSQRSVTNHQPISASWEIIARQTPADSLLIRSAWSRPSCSWLEQLGLGTSAQNVPPPGVMRSSDVWSDFGVTSPCKLTSLWLSFFRVATCVQRCAAADLWFALSSVV